MDHQYTNHLISETSPYLLQHAHNPVNWYPWSNEALEKAKTENKIILVSIGYSACHWCHVMERESFEDEATAAVMNRYFINIKIDREERPDLDHIYMDAVQAMSGSGGWPLNVFLTPDTKPFYGGTYFPPRPAFNRPSWVEVLNSVAQAWAERRHEIEAQAENVTAYLHQSNSLAQPKINLVKETQENLFTSAVCENIFTAIMKTADRQWGGFGKAPKFPQTFTIQYLLQYHHFSNNEMALQQALLSIDKMLQGGIYDHVAGGMARYSTDTEWLAPHFEKMLYDNALLVNILCDAYQIIKDEKYAAAILKTISFVQNELTNSENGFYAALDADSEGEEGKYYVWQKSEIENILGSDAMLFCEFFDITEKGNWEAKNILRILKPADAFVKEKGINKGLFDKTMQSCLQKLLQERNKRIKPGLDDKAILGWNALMLNAVAKAAVVLQNEALTTLAVNNFNFIHKHFTVAHSKGELKHTWKNGKVKYTAFLDDYANFISALIQLYEATFKTEYLQQAKLYCEYVTAHFSDEEEIFFFYTSNKQTDVIVRKKEIYDGAVPSGNAVMASSLIKLSVIFNRPEWRERAEKMLETILPLSVKYPGSFAIWASLILQQSTVVNEIAVTGKGAYTLASGILKNYIPFRVIMASETAIDEFPLLAQKPHGDFALAYLCKDYSCKVPVSSAEKLYEQIV